MQYASSVNRNEEETEMAKIVTKRGVDYVGSPPFECMIAEGEGIWGIGLGNRGEYEVGIEMGFFSEWRFTKLFRVLLLHHDSMGKRKASKPVEYLAFLRV